MRGKRGITGAVTVLWRHPWLWIGSRTRGIVEDCGRRVVGNADVLALTGVVGSELFAWGFPKYRSGWSGWASLLVSFRVVGGGCLTGTVPPLTVVGVDEVGVGLSVSQWSPCCDGT